LAQVVILASHVREHNPIGLFFQIFRSKLCKNLLAFHCALRSRSSQPRCFHHPYSVRRSSQVVIILQTTHSHPSYNWPQLFSLSADNKLWQVQGSSWQQSLVPQG